MAAVTRAELLEVVYLFHPRGLTPDDLGYEATEERQRQRDAMDRALAGAPTWDRDVDRLQARDGPPWIKLVLIRAGRYDPAWSGPVISSPDTPSDLRVCARALLRDSVHGRRRRGRGGARSRPGD